ncbi:DUF4383 domain-containing protein [Arthrobacter sp. H5]|uniref:DUF4383 domain-containing protein n=1 Tax=Arthrobacter sp. H5 TaxID=1267973 RepID=UPI0012DD3C54|nr:DUF4383 domain-containing protein [Arthrobacter sp. H5]
MRCLSRVVWHAGLIIDHESAANFVPLNGADKWLPLLLGIAMIGLALALSGKKSTRVWGRARTALSIAELADALALACWLRPTSLPSLLTLSPGSANTETSAAALLVLSRLTRIASPRARSVSAKDTARRRLAVRPVSVECQCRSMGPSVVP